MTDKVDYGLISADSHVFEPADLFEKRLPSHLRDRAPQVRDSNGGSAWFVEDVVPVPFPESAVTGSGYRVRDLSNPDRPVTVDEIMPALYDPAERIKAQDADSVDAEVLYASPHLWDAIKQVDDTELRLECARAYNDWISEFCSHDPSRLIGIGKLPSSSIEDARKELVGGYWLINVKSLAEAIEWAKRCPGDDCIVEVRQVQEMSDFPADVQEAAAGFTELQSGQRNKG